MKEIERKFLTTDDSWKSGLNGKSYRQGYLSPSGATATTRIRIVGDKAWITIKGPPTGISRDEFEYAVPLADAESLLNLCEGSIIEKTRYLMSDGYLTWEIDEFHGENAGLIVAEIELPDESTAHPTPAWLGEEVSHERRYTNAALAHLPFSKWPDADKICAND